MTGPPMHVCLPRAFRMVIQLTHSDALTVDAVRDAAHTSIREQHVKHVVLFLEASHAAQADGQTLHQICFLRIPSELCHKLRSNGLTRCIFYACNRDDVTHIQVLDGPPADVAHSNDDGMLLPYKSECVDLTTL